MEILNDGYSILEQFNHFAGQLGVHIEHPNFDVTEFEFEMELTIPDVDDFWGIVIDGKDIVSRHIEYFATMSDHDRRIYLDGAENFMKNYPSLYEHYLVKMEKATVSLADKLRYLPHVLDYMTDIFGQLEGYKALQSILSEKGLESEVLIAPRGYIPEKENHLHGFNAYTLTISISEKESVNPEVSAPQHRLH